MKRFVAAQGRYGSSSFAAVSRLPRRSSATCGPSSFAARSQSDAGAPCTANFGGKRSLRAFDEVTTWRSWSARDPRRRPDGGLRSPLSTAAMAVEEDADDDSAGGQVVPFLLADIGEGIAEVELMQWFVSPGDTIAQFDRVCEVQSDKATVEITSRYDGVVRSVDGNVGDMIKVGAPLLHIAVDGAGGVANEAGGASSGEESDGEVVTNSGNEYLHTIDDVEDALHIPSVASTFPAASTSFSSPDEADAPTGGPSAGVSSGKVLASPAVRKLGKENNIDLATVLGTGPKGRILKADMLKILGRYHEPTKPSTSLGSSAGSAGTLTSSGVAPPTAPPRPAVAPAATTTDGGSELDLSNLREDTVVPIRGYHRLMLKSMTASLQIPHMCYSDEVDVTALQRTRVELKPLAEREGLKLSFLPFAIKAASLALREYPVLNSTLNDDDDGGGEASLTYRADHNVGVAMDTPRGLAVAVIRRCQDLSVLEVCSELNRLQRSALDGTLSEGDVSGATFSLSNIGAIGGTYMSPIVVPPQVAIGAMGKIQRVPRFADETSTHDSNKVVAVDVMQVSWGADHRVVDGATLARFSNAWKGYLESPSSMIFSMR